MEITTMTSTYILITVVMIILAWIYNNYIEGEGSCIPTSLKVTIGVFGTEMFRIMRIVLLVHLAWPFIEPYIMFTEIQTILGIMGFWFTDVLLGYGASGGPMIHGDLRRAHLARAQATTADDEVGTRAIRDIEETTEAIRGRRT